MIFLWILLGIFVLLGFFMLWQWWRDEQEKLGKVFRRQGGGPTPGKVIPSVVSRATPLHPSIDPYLAELRASLFEAPLPRSPGEMANRVYAHLTDWLNRNAMSEPSPDEYEFIEVEPRETPDGV